MDEMSSQNGTVQPGAAVTRAEKLLPADGSGVVRSGGTVPQR